MAKATNNENIKNAYDCFDKLKERMEFNGDTENLKILDDAMDHLNRYLSVVEKFDPNSGARTLDKD